MSRLKNRLAENETKDYDQKLKDKIQEIYAISDDAFNGDSDKIGEYVDYVIGQTGAPYNTSPVYQAIHEYFPELEGEYEKACDSLINGFIPMLELVSKVNKSMK
jgi:acetone carboxylase gamma subunit